MRTVAPRVRPSSGRFLALVAGGAGGRGLVRTVFGAVGLRESARLGLLGGSGDRPAWWGHGLEAGLLCEIRRPRVAQGFGAAASVFAPVRLVIAPF